MADSKVRKNLERHGIKPLRLEIPDELQPGASYGELEDYLKDMQKIIQQQKEYLTLLENLKEEELRTEIQNEKELKSLQKTLRRENDELASLNVLTQQMDGCDDIFGHTIANQEIQKLAFGALQNQVQERISADENRIENELIARRDIMKIKFNLKIENMMFAIAMKSDEFHGNLKNFEILQNVDNDISKKIKELWHFQQQSSVGRLKKFPVELVPNMRTYIVRLAALAISAEHPLSNGKKMEIVKRKTLLKIPSLRLTKSNGHNVDNNDHFMKPATAPVTRSLNETAETSGIHSSQGFSTDCSQ